MMLAFAWYYLDTKWFGPFTIVGSLGRTLYRLQKIDSNEIIPQ